MNFLHFPAKENAVLLPQSRIRSTAPSRREPQRGGQRKSLPLRGRWQSAWTILINLARLASLILCVYAACMIAHQFPKHVMVAGILAFIGLNIVETQLDKLLGTNDVSMIVDVTYRVVDGNVTGVSYGVTPMRWLTAALGTDVGYLFCFAVTAAIAAAYFFLTRWLMKNKLNLE